MSYVGYCLQGGYYLSAEVLSVYFTASTDWAIVCLCVCIYIYIFMGKTLLRRQCFNSDFSINTMLMQSQLRWAGHVVCINDHCILKKLLYGKLSQDKRFQEGQKKRFKDKLKVFLKSFGIVLNCQEYLVQNRDKWHEFVKHGAKYVKPEETQQLSCAGKLEKALPHQSLPPPFLVLTVQDSSAHRLVSLAICAFTDAVLNHKVQQMALIDYDWQRTKRREEIWENESKFNSIQL